jgi:hypothetical protein
VPLPVVEPLVLGEAELEPLLEVPSLGLELLGVLGEARVSDELPLIDCAHAALASSAAATAAAIVFNVIAGLLS